MTTSALSRYRTDFNDLDDNGDVTCLTGWGGDVTLPSPGSTVSLFDGDGNTCFGVVTVVDLNTGLIAVEPLWDSWVDATRSTFESVLLDQVRASVEAAMQTQSTESAMSPEPVEAT
jgi:hypothetical protein